MARLGEREAVSLERLAQAAVERDALLQTMQANQQRTRTLSEPSTSKI